MPGLDSLVPEKSRTYPGPTGRGVERRAIRIPAMSDARRSSSAVAGGWAGVWETRSWVHGAASGLSDFRGLLVGLVRVFIIGDNLQLFSL